MTSLLKAPLGTENRSHFTAHSLRHQSAYRPAAERARRALFLLLAMTAPTLCCPPLLRAQGDPVIAAAGDISCDPADPSYNGGLGTATRCHMLATSNLLVGASLARVLILGDVQYEDGALAKYYLSYDPSWGRVKAITSPALGNHEYNTAGAAGYFTYFGAAAGDPAKGYYSFDVGSWHLIALNSNCAKVGGCDADSAQGTWLASDLASNTGKCLLAYWHNPRFSSGPHGGDPSMDGFWRLLFDAGADVVLNGHDHTYERFAPQDPNGASDPVRGIRQFVVGNGGKNLYAFGTPVANSEVRDNTTYGVLELTLHPTGYDWQLVPEAGGSFTDAGSGTCHSAPTATLLHSVTPCRLVDTRDPTGPGGGPHLEANGTRRFPIAGRCGVPASAVAVAVNVTAVDATAPGTIAAFAAGKAAPMTQVIAFPAGRALASNAQVGLGAFGELGIRCEMPSATVGSVHLVLDITGYYE